MILITLLLVLIIERIAATTKIWQFSFYYQKYFALWSKHLGVDRLSNNRFARWSYLLLPAVVIGLISWSIDWILVDLAFNIVVLLICIGCIHKRKIYKQFLNAANRGDEQACHLYATQLREYESNPPTVFESKPDSPTVKQDSVFAHASLERSHSASQDKIEEPVIDKVAETATEKATEKVEPQGHCDVEGHRLGLTLIWFNFKYYCAVLFWFVCAGPAGAVGYCMMREAFDDKNGLVTLKETASIKRWLHVLDWLPARVCSAGYLLIGDFTRSSGIWLGYLLDFKSPAKNLVCDIAQAAETIELQHNNKILEPVCMLKLAKRNILFFLAMVAILTLYGGIA